MDRKSKSKESKYPRDEFVQNAQALFNVKPEVVIGALSKNENKELSVSEVKKAIDDFLKRKVK